MKTKTMKKLRIQLGLVAMILLGFFSAKAQNEIDSKLEARALETIENFQTESWEIQSIMENSYAYVVFPSVGKGGIGIGGAHGKGVLFKDGSALGEAKLTQISVGFQWGGQSYSEIIFLEDEKALEQFQANKLELAAQASAIAVKEGISTDVPYRNGVAVYTLPKAGLMYEAAIGGQKFKYFPEEIESESDDL